jgi:hypothetical protein
MRLQSVIGVFALGLALFAVTTPAAAQGQRIDISGGYQLLRFFDDDSNIPKGWGASFAAGKEQIKGVADFGGHYFEGEQMHTFQGGVEFSGKNARAVPYVRALGGVALFAEAYGAGATSFVFTPEAGVKVMANKHVGVQTSVGFPIFVNSDDAAGAFRFFVGVVVRK